MSPLPHFATGDPLGAAEANLIARQGVITVPTVAARDNLPAPHDGMVCFVEADQTYYVRIEGVWRVGWRAATSPMVQRGRIDVTVGASQSSGTQQVTFPVPFPSTPRVICQPVATTAFFATTGSLNSSGFLATAFRTAGTAAANVPVDWIAVA